MCSSCGDTNKAVSIYSDPTKVLETFIHSPKITHWIRSDLKVVKKNFLTKLFWAIFGGFNWVKKNVFHLDSWALRGRLFQISQTHKVKSDPKVWALYKVAVAKFNEEFKSVANLIVPPAPSSPPVPPRPPAPPVPPTPPAPPAPPPKFDDAKNIRFQKIQAEAKSPSCDPYVLLQQSLKNLDLETALWLISSYKLDLNSVTVSTGAKEKQLLDWLKIRSEKLSPTPENLDHFALNLGYGYKTANLLVLQRQTEEMNKKLKAAEVKVPPFVEIPDLAMQNFLIDACPEILVLWNQFLNQSFSPAEKAAFLSAKEGDKVDIQISSQGKSIIKQIQDKVTRHFLDNLYQSPQINAWLAQVNPEKVIVRSTGKEDTDTNSNAGGNDSLPFIAPDAKSISTAMGKVLASYFGEKSIGQRLIAGDKKSRR